ncbi:MAG: hypothetical protein QOF48_2286 [Verrucomicrobiota bacterium]|jgi:hypothetical protein
MTPFALAFARPLFAIVSALPFLTNALSAAEPFQTHRHDEHEFSIDIPSGWVPLPAAKLGEMTQALKAMSSAATFAYSHGYQRDSGPPYPIFPYVLIQVNNRQRIPEREVANLSKSRAAVEEGMRSVQNARNSTVSGARLGEMVYDTNAHIIWLNMELQVAGVGPARGLTGMVLTEKGFIQVNCYAVQAEFPALVETFEKIIRSVQVSEKLRYQPGRGGTFSLRALNFGRVGKSAIIGGIAGGVIGLVFALMKRRQKPPASPPTGPPPLP